MQVDKDMGLEELCEVIGYDATRTIAAWFSSGCLHVPTKIDEGHPLVTLIGAKNLRKLVSLHGGERVRIPHSREDSVKTRERHISEMIASGMKAAAVARVFNLSERRIEMLRLELEAKGFLIYAGGYRRRPQGRPSGGGLGIPEILGTG